MSATSPRLRRAANVSEMRVIDLVQFAEEAGNSLEVFIPTSGKVEDDNLVGAQPRHQGCGIGDRMGALQSGDNPLGLSQQLHALYRLMITHRDILHSMLVVQVAQFRTNPRIVQPWRE